MESEKISRAAKMAILVSALGYFVDIYDLLLFSIVRVASLKSIGVPEEELLDKGVLLINTQMAGLLLGGIFWGVLADRKGRLSVLFGSILLYSVANVANAFVQTVPQYAALRFIAGIGLAGELGAGITLVCELMPKKSRGYGTMLVATIGILGAVFAALIGQVMDWRHAYILGGVMGLMLLVLRVSLNESGMFESLKHKGEVSRGNFFALFTRASRFKKYFAVILVGVPIWFIVGIPVTFAPEFGKSFLMEELPKAGTAVLFCYLGISGGDLLSGTLSQVWGTRKKVLLLFIAILGSAYLCFTQMGGISLSFYYAFCFLMGLGAGYWAMFVTVASEQFGTNIRATATTSAPNFVRGAVIPITTSFGYLKTSMGVLPAASVVGAVTVLLAILAVLFLEETFGKNLDYLE